MKPQRYEAEELDDASLDYLRTARENHGRGVPGIYLDDTAADLSASSLPGCGAVIGGVLMVVAIILMFSLILGDPFNLAMLVTAFAFLGAWLVVAWIRCLIARGSKAYVGHFKYFDPLYLWGGAGGGVEVAPLRGLQEARCKHEYSGEGGYASSIVSVVMEERAFNVKVKNEALAEALEIYLNEMARDREGLPIERGYEAAERAMSEVGDEAPEERLVESLPEPHKVRTSIGWLIRYPVVLALFALTFFLVYQMCKLWRDDAFFAAITRKNPPDLADLRAYIADPRNTRHRASVLQILKQAHEQTANAIENQPGEEDLKKGLADLVRSLSESPAPVITFAYVRSPDRKPDSMDGILGPAETDTLIATQTKLLIDKFIERMKATPAIGPTRADQISWYIGVRDRFAMITIDPRLNAAANQKNLYTLVWTVTLQTDESDAAKAKAKVVRWKQDIAALDPADLKRQFRDACEKFPERFAQALQIPIPPNQKP